MYICFSFTNIRPNRENLSLESSFLFHTCKNTPKFHIYVRIIKRLLNGENT